MNVSVHKQEGKYNYNIVLSGMAKEEIGFAFVIAGLLTSITLVQSATRNKDDVTIAIYTRKREWTEDFIRKFITHLWTDVVDAAHKPAPEEQEEYE